MKLNGSEMRKYEYVLDIFKGTCELNNFEPMYVPAYDEEKPNDDILKNILKYRPNDMKAYFYGPVLDGEECVLIGGVCEEKNQYTYCEIINMCVKLLSNMKVEDSSVGMTGDENDETISNLEALDIEVDYYNDESSGEDKNSFTVYVDDEPVIYGGLRKDGLIYFYSDIETLMDYVPYDDYETSLDAYVAPTSKDVLDDAFVIGSNLKDAGFKVEVDYSLKQVTKEQIDAQFLITFDMEDISKYQVKLVDLDTKEIKTVKIDNLVEELSFI